MKKGSFFRFFMSCIIVYAVLILNAFSLLNSSVSAKNNNATQLQIQWFDDNSTEIEKSESSAVDIVPQITSSQSENASVPTDTSAVKGKIISQYISPYKAPMSYEGVYIKNSSSKEFDIKTLLNSKLKYNIEKNTEPQVLIMHTHTTETYMQNEQDYYTENFNSRTTDNTKNMAIIGDKVTEILNSAGIKTLHDTTQHDYPQYTGSYSRSAKTIYSYLKKYPTIKVVLDLHRDAVSSGESDKVKLVTEIEGKKCAQVMFVMGSGCGENWQENLKLAIKLQQTMEKMYPTLARPISVTNSSYNQGITNGSILLEVGTDANTLTEALNSAELVGNSIAKFLGG